MKTDYDIIIIGSGIVGASAACALADLTLSIAVIDQGPIKKVDVDVNQEIDGRKIVLSYGSHKIFQYLKILPVLANYITPIKQVHVSKKGGFAATRLYATDINAENLGYVVPAEILLQALINKSTTYTNIIHFASTTVLDINAAIPSIAVQLNKKTVNLKAKLIIAADGALSYSRKLLDIPTIEKDYQQTALATSVKVEGDVANIAYQRLVNDAVMAMLPMQQQTYGIVYTSDSTNINKLMTLDKVSLCNVFQQQFGYRLGCFSDLGPCFTYPLKLIIAEKQIHEKILLLGNAAHNISPIAAQGFNLALQDIYCLQQLLLQFPNHYARVLETYEQQRLPEQQRIIKFTDRLMAWSKHKYWSSLQSLGLLLLDLNPKLKKQLITLNMGLTPQVQQLMRNTHAE